MGLRTPVGILDDWTDWVLLDCVSDTPYLSFRCFFSQLEFQLRPTLFQGVLLDHHYSPWSIPSGTVGRLRSPIRDMLASLYHDAPIPELSATTVRFHMAFRGYKSVEATLWPCKFRLQMSQRPTPPSLRGTYRLSRPFFIQSQFSLSLFPQLQAPPAYSVSLWQSCVAS